MDAHPTITDLAHLHASSASLDLVGTIDHRYVTSSGALDAGRWTFSHSSVDKWRIERGGTLQYISDGEKSYYATSKGMLLAKHRQTNVASLLPVSPRSLIGGPGSILNGLNVEERRWLIEPGVESGRACWHAVGQADDGITLTFDTRTGALLGVKSTAPNIEAAVITLELHDALDPILFQLEEEPTTRPAGQGLFTRVERESTADLDRTMPRYWPSGLGYNIRASDSDTGEYVASLTVQGWPLLARWPRGAVAQLIDDSMSIGYAFQYEWSLGSWEWRLFSRTELAESDLQEIRNSMRSDT